MADKKILRVLGIGLIVVLALAFVFVFASHSYLKRGIQGRVMATEESWVGSGSLEKNDVTNYAQDSLMERSSAPMQSLPVKSVDISRKLIQNASLNLKVKDCMQAQAEIEGFIGKFKGIIVNSQINTSNKAYKSGDIVFKIQPKEMGLILSEIKKLGEVEAQHVSSEDVTEQYVDLQARLKNLLLVRDRLTKILNERARDVKDILSIERELSRLGGDIESLEGRIKYLDRQVDLSTVTVYFHELHRGIVGSLDFWEKFQETLRVSLETFVSTFNGIIIAISFFLPILIWGGIIWLLFSLYRRLFRKG